MSWQYNVQFGCRVYNIMPLIIIIHFDKWVARVEITWYTKFDNVLYWKVLLCSYYRSDSNRFVLFTYFVESQLQPVFILSVLKCIINSWFYAWIHWHKNKWEENENIYDPINRNIISKRKRINLSCTFHYRKFWEISN